MVVGHGLVAQAFYTFKTDDRFLIFASGVSDSTNTDRNAFDREKVLLIQSLREHREKIFVYFSTCSVYDTTLHETPYVMHKVEMERIVSQESERYYIFRVSNLVGNSSNPHTILNFFVQHILTNTFFYLWKGSSRNLIDVEDAFSICNHILHAGDALNKTVNVASSVSYDVLDIIKEVESFFGKRGNYEIVLRRSKAVIDISDIQMVISSLNIKFDGDYLGNILKKYFTTHDVSTG